MFSGFERLVASYSTGHLLGAERAAGGSGTAFLPSILALSYGTLHLGVTLLVLVWLYRRRPVAHARARTTVLGATAIALIVHVAFPTAPPRLAAVGIAHTVAGIGVDLSSELLGVFYDPNAAVPSTHFGYALVVSGVKSEYASGGDAGLSRGSG